MDTFMAGDWLKVEKTTPDKPEILAIAARLNLDPEIVFTKCFKVWCWADSHTPDGNVLRVTPALLDALIHTPGFANALLEVGWLVARNGSLQFPNFDRHMGQSGKKRALASERASAHRHKSNATSVTEALPEKRREEKIPPPSSEESPLAPQDGFPPCLDTLAFRRLWDRWRTHRVEIRHKLTPTQEETQLKKLASWGVVRATEALERSITNGWTGFDFNEKGPSNGNGRPAHTRVAGRFDPAIHRTPSPADTNGQAAGGPADAGEGHRPAPPAGGSECPGEDDLPF